MVPDPVAAAVHRFRRFLGDHFVLRSFAIPILVLASVLVVVLVLGEYTTPAQTAQVVAVYLLFSGAVVGASLAIERTLEWLVAR